MAMRILLSLAIASVVLAATTAVLAAFGTSGDKIAGGAAILAMWGTWYLTGPRGRPGPGLSPSAS
jgi:hypothetical protein